VKNRWGSFVADQNFLPIFHWANYILKKLPYFSLFLYFSIYTLNNSSSLGESPKWRGKLESEIGGNQSPKLVGSCT